MDSQHHSNLRDTAKSLAQLGQNIKDNADRIQSYLSQNHIDDPTFTFGASPRLDLPVSLEWRREELFDDVEHLTALLRGPLGHVLTNSNPVTLHYTIVLSAISRFGIAEHVPLDGRPISVSELAAACHLEPTDLKPLLRAAIANRTFEAVGDSEVKHNAVSAIIGTMPDLRYWLAYSREDFIPAAFALPEAIAKWPGAVTPEQAAFTLINPDYLPFFDAIKSNPVRTERFAGSMRLLSGATVAEIPRVVEALGFDGLTNGSTVVDVGGSMGEILSQILRRYVHLKGVVEDLKHVVADAKVPEDLQGRLTFQVADLFEEQPRRRADVYFLRKVLHDWSDEYAAKIIRQLVPALKHGAKIILNEMCLPSPGSIHPRREQSQCGWDLAMKWLFNGKERDEAEWRTLFTSVDERFKWVGVRSVHAASSSLIELVWNEP